jgi:predicted amidophosphoribosyltransferase
VNSEPVCIYCGEPLSKWERIRCYCWNCNELTTAEASHEENEDTV